MLVFADVAVGGIVVVVADVVVCDEVVVDVVQLTLTVLDDVVGAAAAAGVLA